MTASGLISPRVLLASGFAFVLILVFAKQLMETESVPILQDLGTFVAIVAFCALAVFVGALIVKFR
jgi:hypothetical protein